MISTDAFKSTVETDWRELLEKTGIPRQVALKDRKIIGRICRSVQAGWPPEEVAKGLNTLLQIPEDSADIITTKMVKSVVRLNKANKAKKRKKAGDAHE